MYLAQDRDQWQAIVNNNEPSDSVKGKEFLEHQSDSQRLEKDAAP
jgi:hypothetical protein